MARFNLSFNVPGKCMLCNESRKENPNKRIVRLIPLLDTFIIMKVCNVCLERNFKEAISQDTIIEKEFTSLRGCWVSLEKEPT